MQNSVLSLIFPIQSLEKLTDQNNDVSRLISKESNFRKNLLFFGDNSLFKTSLIFQSCLSSANAYPTKEVIYIRKEDFKSIPLFVHNMPKPSNENLLKQIKFKYFQTTDQLIEYLADVHLNQKTPSHIVVEDLVDFLDIHKHEQVDIELDCIRQNLLIGSHIKSVLDYLNTVSNCTGIVGTRQKCEEANRLKYLFDSYCSINTIDKDILYEIVYKNCLDENLEYTLKFENRDSDLCLYNIREDKLK
ncbi:ATPase SWSAP1-like [Brachionus plicatilis]|uniref:ATPase SWSAP1-like n=1 Tax=Brachionus plicatilis TaxID=10195 RepID=A0A3M7Q8B6_BRAPC|nr:ATPase SWSAP1-like [Brachionus plicatilis]